MDKIAVNLHGVTNRNRSSSTASSLRGVFTPGDEHFAIEQFLLHGGPLSVELTGGVTLVKNQTPAIDLCRPGRRASNVSDALHYWPLQVGEGAREWIDANIPTGTHRAGRRSKRIFPPARWSSPRCPKMRSTSALALRRHDQLHPRA